MSDSQNSNGSDAGFVGSALRSKGAREQRAAEASPDGISGAPTSSDQSEAEQAEADRQEQQKVAERRAAAKRIQEQADARRNSSS